MRYQRILQEPLIQQLFVMFLLFGLIPTLVVTTVPTAITLIREPTGFAISLPYFLAFQAIILLMVIFGGATTTLKYLVLPIQELVKGAHRIAQGDFAYRVPITQSNQELASLTETFNAMAEAVEAMRDDVEQQRSILQATLERRENEFQAILEIVRLVNQQADLPCTAKKALTIARDILGTDNISLVLVDDSGDLSSSVYACENCLRNPLQSCDSCQEGEQLRDILRHLKCDLLQKAVSSEEMLRIPNIFAGGDRLAPQLISKFRDMGVQKIAVKPLTARGRVVGVLVLMRQALDPVPERSATLLTPLADIIAVLIENWHLQNQVRSLTIMEERRRLANELHDSVTQSLFSLNLTARGLKSILECMPDIDLEMLDTFLVQTGQVQTEMRRLINEMRPIELGPGDLESALRQHVMSVRDSTEIEVDFIISGNPRLISQPIQQSLNRIAQEALSNVARHAAANHAELSLDVNRHFVRLSISDNGIGFDPRAVTLQPGGSWGLVSMRERAEMLGGALIVRSQPALGTTVSVQIPLDNEANI